MYCGLVKHLKPYGTRGIFQACLAYRGFQCLSDGSITVAALRWADLMNHFSSTKHTRLYGTMVSGAKPGCGVQRMIYIMCIVLTAVLAPTKSILCHLQYVPHQHTLHNFSQSSPSRGCDTDNLICSCKPSLQSHNSYFACLAGMTSVPLDVQASDLQFSTHHQYLSRPTTSLQRQLQWSYDNRRKMEKGTLTWQSQGNNRVITSPAKT